MKKRGWIAGLAALMLLSGCGAFPEEGSGVTETLLGDTFSTRWFDCAAEEAESGSPMRAIQPPVGTSWWWWSWS